MHRPVYARAGLRRGRKWYYHGRKVRRRRVALIVASFFTEDEQKWRRDSRDYYEPWGENFLRTYWSFRVCIYDTALQRQLTDWPYSGIVGRSVKVPAMHAGTENISTYYNTLTAVPQTEGKGKERQDVNNADASSGPTDDDACGEDADCGSCTPWTNKDVPSDRACNRIQKRKKQAEVYERCVVSIHFFRPGTDMSIL